MLLLLPLLPLLLLPLLCPCSISPRLSVCLSLSLPCVSASVRHVHLDATLWLCEGLMSCSHYHWSVTWGVGLDHLINRCDGMCVLAQPTTVAPCGITLSEGCGWCACLSRAVFSLVLSATRLAIAAAATASALATLLLLGPLSPTDLCSPRALCSLLLFVHALHSLDCALQLPTLLSLYAMLALVCFN